MVDGAGGAGGLARAGTRRLSDAAGGCGPAPGALGRSGTRRLSTDTGSQAKFGRSGTSRLSSSVGLASSGTRRLSGFSGVDFHLDTAEDDAEEDDGEQGRKDAQKRQRSLNKQAPSLESWFDAGLAEEEAEDGKAHLVGVRPVPHGYNGCDRETCMLWAEDAEVEIWPVRFDLGDVAADTGQRPWTLFHFTHQACFEECLKLVAKAQASGHALDADAAGRSLLGEIEQDFLERSAKPSALNPKNDLEMVAIEPARFESRDDVLRAMYYGRVPVGVTHSGHTFDRFADCCIGVRVPGSACTPVMSDKGGNGMTVRIDRDVLDSLRVRGEALREAAKAKAEAAAGGAEEDEDKATDGAGRHGCLQWLLHTADFRDWDEVHRRRELHRRHIGEGRVCREKKMQNIRASQMTERWAKEHFANAKKTRDSMETKRRRDQLLEADREKRRQRQLDREASSESAYKLKARAGPCIVVQSADADARADKRKKKRRGPEETIPQKISRWLRGLIGSDVDVGALEMYRTWRTREQGHKEIAMPPLTRMKSMRSRYEEQLKNKEAVEEEMKALGFRPEDFTHHAGGPGH